MNCQNIRKLLDQSNEMSVNNIWEKKAYVINMKIWEADHNNFAACTRLANYYKLNDNMPEAKKMFLNALEIYPNNYVVRNNLNEIELINEQTKFIDDLTTSRECYNSGRRLTRSGNHWLAGECYFKAYSMDPLLEYAVALAKSYHKMGKHDRIKMLYKELIDNNTTLDMIDDIKVEFAELLKQRELEQKKENIA